MKLKNNIFFNDAFVPAFQKLLNFDLESPISVRIIKSVKILDEQQYAVFMVRDNLLSQYATKLESGAPKIINGEVYFDTPQIKAEFEKKYNDLLRDEFEIPLNEKIKLTKKHKISGLHLGAILDIVEVIDDNGGK